MRTRIRSVKPELFSDFDLYEAERESGLPLRLAFSGLWCVADREGRFPWKPQEIKNHVIPYDSCNMADVLDALEVGGFIASYIVGEKRYGVVVNFKRHQAINMREAASEIPPPPAAITVPEHIPVNVAPAVRAEVIARDSGKCVVCGATDDLTVDHIEQRNGGGDHSPENLRTLCRSCNSRRPVVEPEGDTYASTCMHVGNGSGNGTEGEPEKTKAVARTDNTLPAVQDHLREVGLEAMQKAKRSEARSLGAEFVFAYWCKKLRHENALLDTHRERAIVKALTENGESVSELLYVVDGASRDEWASQEIGRHDPKVLFRDRTSVEKYAGKCSGYKAGDVHPTWLKAHGEAA